MDYVITLKLNVKSPSDHELLAKQLRSALEFGTVGEVLTDAMDASKKIGITEIVVRRAAKFFQG